MHALSLSNKALLSRLFVTCKSSGDAVNARRFAVRKAATYDWLQLAADSTGRRNTFAEHLSGCVEAERLARPLVQLSRDRVELNL